jgi:hypothetical protein
MLIQDVQGTLATVTLTTEDAQLLSQTCRKAEAEADDEWALLQVYGAVFDALSRLLQLQADMPSAGQIDAGDVSIPLADFRARFSALPRKAQEQVERLIHELLEAETAA